MNYLGFSTRPEEWEVGLGPEVLPRLDPQWTDLGLTAAWHVQSHLAAAALVGLVAFTSVWIALAIMIVWSLITTFVYFHARSRGLPDLLTGSKKPRRSTRGPALLVSGACEVARIGLIGLPALVYSRALAPVLSRRDSARGAGLARKTVLAVGLTLFGVVPTQHLLSRAGYRGRELLHLSFLGVFLNVSYRVLLAAMVLDLVTRLLQAPVRFV